MQHKNAAYSTLGCLNGNLVSLETTDRGVAIDVATALHNKLDLPGYPNVQPFFEECIDNMDQLASHTTRPRVGNFAVSASLGRRLKALSDEEQPVYLVIGETRNSARDDPDYNGIQQLQEAFRGVTEGLFRHEQHGSSVILAQPNLSIDASNGRTALLLPISPESISEVLLSKLTDEGFCHKEEFHVTVVDIKQDSELAKIIGTLSEASQKELNDLLVAAQQQYWEITLKPEFYAVEKDYPGESLPRKSIIQMVVCPPLDSFIQQINQLLPNGEKIENRPAHITLATQGDPRGIGLNTVGELKKYSKPFDASAS